MVWSQGCCAGRLAAHRAAAAALEQFALATCALAVVAFLWPADFYYHYAAFLAPFLALAIALPVARRGCLGAARGGPWPPGRGRCRGHRVGRRPAARLVVR